MLRRVLPAAGVALVLAGCGGGDAHDVLGETAGNLGKIRSGTLHFELVVDPRAAGARNPFGFKLDGPFALGRGNSLPVLRVAYTQIANGTSATVTIVSTGRKAYVETGGKTYELGPSQTEQLRTAGAQARAAGGLAQFPVESWIEDAELSDGGEVGGAETDKISARVDVVAAANDLLDLARAFGRDVPAVRGREAKRLADSVRSSSFELHTGKDDRLLRRLAIDVDFGLDVPQGLRAALGDLVGAKVRFRLGVDDPNRPVSVPEPQNALPPSALPSA